MIEVRGFTVIVIKEYEKLVPAPVKFSTINFSEDNEAITVKISLHARITSGKKVFHGIAPARNGCE